MAHCHAVAHCHAAMYCWSTGISRVNKNQNCNCIIILGKENLQTSYAMYHLERYNCSYYVLVPLKAMDVLPSKIFNSITFYKTSTNIQHHGVNNDQ